MNIKRKILLIVITILLSCIMFSCNNKNFTNNTDTNSGKNPRDTSISCICENTKEKFYPDWSIRIFNPIYATSNLGVDTLENDSCYWISYDVQRYYLDNGFKSFLPAYRCGNCGITNAYFNALYKDIITLDVLKSLYPTCESFEYQLQGFSFNISIKQGDALLTSTTSSFSTISFYDSQKGIGGNIDIDFPGFTEGEYITFGQYTFLNKMSRYQAEGVYKGLSYKTCTVIHPLDKNPRLCIKNIIRIDENINDYQFSYYVCDVSFVSINNLQKNEIYTENAFDPILNPLRAKTIDMAQSFIDHSLDYLNE